MSTYAKLPDFLIIGAGKSGTTSVNNYLAQHPQIFISPVKEPNFFAYETIHDESILQDQFLYDHYHQSVTNFEDYVKLFSKAKKGQIIGETSNTYLYTPTAPHRIKHYIPQTKLIVFLRHPADRLYSRYLHLAKYNQQPTKKFADALARDSIWWKRPDLIHEGLYYTHLSNYFSIFNSQQIKVYLYEDLKSNMFQVLESIFAFLGVDSNFKPDTTMVYNKSGLVKNQIYNKIIGYDSFVQKLIKSVLPTNQYALLRNNTFLQWALDALRDYNLYKPTIDPKIRNRLVQEVYYDEIQRLQQLIDRDLSAWLLLQH